MARVSLRIPQIGEGLQEARLVAVLKQPGEKVQRDEPLYQMETDKAVMDVESPYSGVLLEWLAQPDEVLAIGAEVAAMETLDEVSESSGHGPAATAGDVAKPVASGASPDSSAPQNLSIPPRTRAYALEKGIAEADLAKIPAAGSKLMPADVDAYLSGGPTAAKSEAFEERAVPAKQRLLNSRMVRGQQQAVPGTMTVVANWGPIEQARAKIKAGGGDFQPSSFTLFAFAVAKAVSEFPALKTVIVGDDTFRTYKALQLGIAVGLPGDELVLAVVEDADSLSWRDFANRTREKIDLARTGRDQANEAVTLSLTNMQSFGLRDAVPVVVPPSVGTLFLGEAYTTLDPQGDGVRTIRAANLALTFDHRVLNGVGAAQFLNRVKQYVETIETIL